MAVQTSAVDTHLRSSQALGLSALTPFSVSTWINANWGSTATPIGTVSLVGIYGPTTDIPLGSPVTAMQVGTRTGSGELSCWTWGGGVLVETANNVMVTLNNTWVHIVYTFDGTTHTVYCNGASMATATTSQINGFLNQVYINGYPGGVLNEVAAFQVDKYSLYRRTLSAAEVLTMYSAAGTRHGIVNDLIAWYEFDQLAEGSTATAELDLSGNGNTLTSTGAGAAITYTYSNTYANANLRPVQ